MEQEKRIVVVVLKTVPTAAVPPTATVYPMYVLKRPTPFEAMAVDSIQVMGFFRVQKQDG
jgi:hypothetical protein